jgi:hypothetical protein
MTVGFVGRKPELAVLQKRLDGITASGAGTALVIKGRRQVGKSRLAQEFCDRAGVPYLFYTAIKGHQALVRRLGQVARPSFRQPGSGRFAAWRDASAGVRLGGDGPDRVSCAGFADAAVTNLALRWLPADAVGAFA